MTPCMSAPTAALFASWARTRPPWPTRTALSIRATSIERRGDRCYFVGRRGGVINVGGVKIHPEEVEAALNSHATVRASRVFARKNPITGALVCADVVLREGAQRTKTSELEILSLAGRLLGPHWFRRRCVSSPTCR